MTQQTKTALTADVLCYAALWLNGVAAACVALAWNFWSGHHGWLLFLIAVTAVLIGFNMAKHFKSYKTIEALQNHIDLLLAADKQENAAANEARS